MNQVKSFGGTTEWYIVIMSRIRIVTVATLSVDVEVASDQSEICESTTTRARPPILTIILLEHSSV